MNKNVDFRLIKPLKKINKLTEEVEYSIPCTVLEIGKKIDSKRYEIHIEYVDFVTGEKIRNTGITYKKSIELFKELDKIPPFQTACNVVKKQKSTFFLKVYGVFNVGFMEKWYNVREILNNDEEEIMEVFKSHYKEFLDWLLENPQKRTEDEDEYDDLPF